MLNKVRLVDEGTRMETANAGVAQVWQGRDSVLFLFSGGVLVNAGKR
jgi:hypothetical protein